MGNLEAGWLNNWSLSNIRVENTEIYSWCLEWGLSTKGSLERREWQSFMQQIFTFDTTLVDARDTAKLVVFVKGDIYLISA